MKITKLVVDVFADQLEQYAQHHQGFTYEPPLECPICFEDEVELTVLYPCCHVICIPCGQHWYGEKIDRGATCDTLTCSSPGCSSHLSLVNRRKLLPNSSLIQLRYNHYVKAVTKIAEENKLACPQPDCPGYFLRLHTNKSAPDYNSESVFCVCPICFVHDRISVYCFKCRLHHTKEEHNALSNIFVYNSKKIMKNWFGVNFDKETESEALVRRMKLVTKKCPACGIPCEKDEACNHCTCLNCGVEFNWAQERLWEGYSEEYRRNAVFNH